MNHGKTFIENMNVYEGERKTTPEPTLKILTFHRK